MNIKNTDEVCKASGGATPPESILASIFHKMPISFECYERYHLGYYSQYSMVHYKQYHLSNIIMAYTSIKKACIRILNGIQAKIIIGDSQCPGQNNSS